MFTGLIETVGIVTDVTALDGGSRITLQAAIIMDAMRLGDSIAIDGACTTVVAFESDHFTIEASPETLAKTTFGQYQAGSRVNLERPLLPTSRIGGHYVTGHIDGTARLINRQPEGISVRLTFELQDKSLHSYVVPKGSIAVSGVSLTVNQVSGSQFSVAIIPHTLTNTTFDQFQPGDIVNIETDLLGKYVVKFLSPYQSNIETRSIGLPTEMDERFMIEQGFMPQPY